MRDEILQAAVTLARKHGFRKITRHDVAKAANAATGTINYHFGDMSGLRVAVVKYAVLHEVLEIVAQGLAERHVCALKAPEKLKRRALRELTGIARL